MRIGVSVLEMSSDANSAEVETEATGSAEFRTEISRYHIVASLLVVHLANLPYSSLTSSPPSLHTNGTPVSPLTAISSKIGTSKTFSIPHSAASFWLWRVPKREILEVVEEERRVRMRVMEVCFVIVGSDSRVWRRFLRSSLISSSVYAVGLRGSLMC